MREVVLGGLASDLRRPRHPALLEKAAPGERGGRATPPLKTGATVPQVDICRISDTFVPAQGQAGDSLLTLPLGSGRR